MEVQLFVYDLSKGLARQMSQMLLGIQIDAVYHTSVVFGGVEYFFGAGVQTCYPGASHHGPPMETVALGTTSLPIEVILEYLESLKEIYTPESYDLFMHNCNNFSNDFSMFLVGKGIPSHITSLPQEVLNTPMGQAFRAQMDASMRSVTQAPVPAAVDPLSRAAPKPASSATNGSVQAAHKPISRPPTGVVHNVSSVGELEGLLQGASEKCAVVFFTSATCAPCRIVYPAYDELAAEAGDRATLIKVDISRAFDVGSKYDIRATPTFITFLKGQKLEQWAGANETQLRGNVRMLLEMANPPHPHTKLDLPTLQRNNLRPILYNKMPPLDKLIARMGSAGTDKAVLAVKDFVATREKSGAREAPLPDVEAFARLLRSSLVQLSAQDVFAITDLFRIALVDPRFSGFMAEESGHATLTFLLRYANDQGIDKAPYTFRLVLLQACCNLFSSPLYPEQIFATPDLLGAIIQFVTANILDKAHANARVAASSFTFNISAYNFKLRSEKNFEPVPEDEQVSLVAALLDAISSEEDEEPLKRLLTALGFLYYCAPIEGDVVNTCKAMEAASTVRAKKTEFPKEPLVTELGDRLL